MADMSLVRIRDDVDNAYPQRPRLADALMDLAGQQLPASRVYDRVRYEVEQLESAAGRPVNEISIPYLTSKLGAELADRLRLKHAGPSDLPVLHRPPSEHGQLSSGSGGDDDLGGLVAEPEQPRHAQPTQGGETDRTSDDATHRIEGEAAAPVADDSESPTTRPGRASYFAYLVRVERLRYEAMLKAREEREATKQAEAEASGQRADRDAYWSTSDPHSPSWDMFAEQRAQEEYEASRWRSDDAGRDTGRDLGR